MSQFSPFQTLWRHVSVQVGANQGIYGDPLRTYILEHGFRVPHGSRKDSAVASTDASVTARQAGVRASSLERITVPTATLDELLERHALHDLDLLQVDTEGHEWQVLQTLDLARHRPALIQMEFGHLSPALIDTVVRHLNGHGYLVHYGGHEADSLAMEPSLLA